MAAVSERPVRLVVADDRERERASVFFRLLLAIPLFIWLALWTVAAVVLAIVNWVVTLARGRSPVWLHDFFASFVRFATHTHAYTSLAAQPYPRFDGKPGYPIDVEIGPPLAQNRAGVAVRFFLAIPALLLGAVLYGSRLSLSSVRGSGGLPPFSLLSGASFLGWFACMVEGRMPRGLRDANAYALSYGAQTWAYLLLVTERYPSSDPATAIGPLPAHEHPIRLSVSDELRRSRLTVFFRLLLALPHLVWLALWSILAYIAAIVSWIATLIGGRSPEALHRFLAAYVRYEVHVYGFLMLIANPFPGFTGAPGSYPVEAHVEPPARQNRWTVLFRLILAIPAAILASAYGVAMYVGALLGWFASLFTAGMPLGLRNLGALALRYNAQTHAYLFLLTGAYPYAGPTSNDFPARDTPAAGPLPAPEQPAPAPGPPAGPATHPAPPGPAPFG